MSSGEILRLIMESGEICNTIYLTAQDWWECYVQRAWLNKQVPHSKSAGTWQGAQPLFKSSLCLPCIYTPSLFPFKKSGYSSDWFMDVWLDRMLVIQCRGLYIRTEPPRPQVHNFCPLWYKLGSAAKRFGKSDAQTRLLISQLTLFVCLCVCLWHQVLACTHNRSTFSPCCQLGFTTTASSLVNISARIGSV